MSGREDFLPLNQFVGPTEVTPHPACSQYLVYVGLGLVGEL